MSDAHSQGMPASRLERIGGLVLLVLFFSPFPIRLYQLGPATFFHRLIEWALSSGWPWVNAPRGLLLLSSACVLAASPRANSRGLRVAMLVTGFGLLLPTVLGTGSSVARTDLLQMGLPLGASVLLGIIQASSPHELRRPL